MEKMKHIKDDLVWLVYKQLEANEATDFKHICTKELGETIDMIKDMAEAIYYCQVVHAMEDGSGTISYTQRDHDGDMTVNLHGVTHPAQS